MALIATLKREPVMTAAALQAGVAMALGFSGWTPEQIVLVLTFTGLVLGLWARSQVTPMATLPDRIAAAVTIEANKNVQPKLRIDPNPGAP